MESATSTSALQFAAACVEIDKHLTHRGRAEFRGRLRHALKSDCGFAPIYLEVLHAIGLSSHGFDVNLPDLEKSARFDVAGERNGRAFALSHQMSDPRHKRLAHDAISFPLTIPTMRLIRVR
jgi:hypothetical protein